MSRTVMFATIGLLGAWGLALAFGDSVRAASEVVALAAGASLLISVAGGSIMVRFRDRSLSVHLWVAAMTIVVGIAAGIVLAGLRMFVSPADERAMLVILVAASSVAVLTTVVLAGWLRRAVNSVTTVASCVGQRPRRDTAPPAVATRELSALVTQLNEVSEQLHEAAMRERSLESSRRELVAWISHDLRTPLAAIRAVSEALEDGVVDDPDTVKKYHQTMRAEVERLNGMVDDLFRLSRIHAGLLTLQVETVTLSDLVSDALSLAAPVARAKGVLLTGEMENDELRVRVATTEFLRVLRNLLDNALRHTPRGGEVSVQAAASASEAVLAVRDTCGGIPEADLGRVFEAGYKGDAARSPEPGARAGLGLAIAQGLVEAHGGTIHVENESDGCRFEVRLPLSVAS